MSPGVAPSKCLVDKDELLAKDAQVANADKERRQHEHEEVRGGPCGGPEAKAAELKAAVAIVVILAARLHAVQKVEGVVAAHRGDGKANAIDDGEERQEAVAVRQAWEGER